MPEIPVGYNKSAFRDLRGQVASIDKELRATNQLESVFYPTVEVNGDGGPM